MQFQDLLVYLDGWSRCETTMRVAALLAKRCNARLSGLHVQGLLLPTQIGLNLAEARDALTSSHALGRLREADLSAGERAQQVFTHHLAATGLQGEWIEQEGLVSHTAGLVARRFDLTVVGQVNPQLPPLGTRAMVPEALFMESGRPVLVVPHTGEFATIGTHVLLAWDGSREATRAVHDALPLLEKAESVRVVTIEREARFADGALADPMDLVRHLERHAIAAQAVVRELRKGAVAETLLSCAAAQHTDLLVMGGYGHSRLFEIVTGGTTRQMLLEMTIPVLLSH